MSFGISCYLTNQHWCRNSHPLHFCNESSCFGTRWVVMGKRQMWAGVPSGGQQSLGGVSLGLSEPRGQESMVMRTTWYHIFLHLGSKMVGVGG